MARHVLGGLLALGVGLCAVPARADQASGDGYLEHIRHQSTLTSTVPHNGDQNPYAVVVSPVTSGKLHEGDVLVTNFNDSNNLQGLGTTIVAWEPATRKLSVFASLPRHLESCPGGVGLTTAFAVLKSGWSVVGSLPSEDGTTATKKDGCLMVLDNQGQLAGVIKGPQINGPWGNMAVVDRGDHATLFVSMTGFGVGAPGQDVVNKATVLRIELDVPEGKPPVAVRQTVVADGFGEQADKAVFVIGPTGLAMGPDDTLFVSDAIGNRVVAIPQASTRKASAGTGREVTKDGFIKRPLALATAPNGHLLVANGLNGQVVEVDPADGHQLYARWIDTDRAQQPPGSGDLFGMAMMLDGEGFYFVQDDMNTLVQARK
ncbi:MAG: hypothetical protein ACRYG6_10730 [Janthinobacterium lividum]